LRDRLRWWVFECCPTREMCGQRKYINTSTDKWIAGLKVASTMRLPLTHSCKEKLVEKEKQKISNRCISSCFHTFYLLNNYNFFCLRWSGNPLKINSHTTLRSRVRIWVMTSDLAISTFVSWAKTYRHYKENFY